MTKAQAAPERSATTTTTTNTKAIKEEIATTGKTDPPRQPGAWHTSLALKEGA
eukprot:CAMPEP_0206244020 /NCGR_PEP_ID=MMETSP0047_2-20121206/17924_1 /ASSEMBLY_ACC=CAM_ASM_000192 /TAXON_ID=195065 /ORGANISM="Chroomonas mesostigmatica_cf, Strain CCMP1168" /LENGTH=52 /DNA_ID=CAMNT_0053669191 /DNA_START=65 /DNA_END=223 /DNA_ORIENTATION=+